MKNGGLPAYEKCRPLLALKLSAIAGKYLKCLMVGDVSSHYKSFFLKELFKTSLSFRILGEMWSLDARF